MFVEFVVAMSLADVCSHIATARTKGYSDAQIEQYAREHAVPERIIVLAKRKCPKA